jgi:hypothetical protein
MKSLNSAVAVLLFSAVVAGVYLYATGDLKLFDRNEVAETDSDETFLKTESEFRRKLAELRMDRDKLIRRKKLMVKRKSETVQFLKEKGITADSDLGDSDVKYAIGNLKRAVADVKEVDKNVAQHDQLISAVEAMLVKMEQERLANEVAVSDEEKIQMSAMLKELDDRLVGDESDIFEDEEIRDLLGKELGQ